jgi:hypothetical protein
MQTLEMQAGGKLFERSRFGVRSTVPGDMLAREGRDMSVPQLCADLKQWWRSRPLFWPSPVRPRATRQAIGRAAP